MAMRAIRPALPRRPWRWPVASCRASPDSSSCSRHMQTCWASDDIVVAVVPGTDVETVLIALDGAGTGIGEMVGCGRAGTTGGCGAGMVEPKISVMNDVAGCADSPRYCVVPLSGVDAEEFAVAAGIVGAVAADGIVPKVPPIADMGVTGTAGVPGTICPVGVEQVTTVPGVDGRPMAVLPMVDTCAKQPVQPTSRVPIINSKRRIAIASSVPFNLSASCYAPRPCCLPLGSPSD